MQQSWQQIQKVNQSLKEKIVKVEREKEALKCSIATLEEEIIEKDRKIEILEAKFKGIEGIMKLKLCDAEINYLLSTQRSFNELEGMRYIENLPKDFGLIPEK